MKTNAFGSNENLQPVEHFVTITEKEYVILQATLAASIVPGLVSRFNESETVASIELAKWSVDIAGCIMDKVDLRNAAWEEL